MDIMITVASLYILFNKWEDDNISVRTLKILKWGLVLFLWMTSTIPAVFDLIRMLADNVAVQSGAQEAGHRMNYFLRTIITVFGCIVLVETMKFILKFAANDIIQKFLSFRQLSEQVSEKKFEFEDKEEKYDVFISFKDEPNITYKLAFARTGLTYILYKLKLGSLSHIKISITAYDKSSHAKIESLQEAKYLKYDGYYCKEDE